MDNPGWHAYSRAQKEQEYYRTHQHHGADGRWQPVEQMPQPFPGPGDYPYTPQQYPYPPQQYPYPPQNQQYPYPSQNAPPSPMAPSPPPKDALFQQPGFHVSMPPPGPPEYPFVSTSTLATRSAIERSQSLRVQRMDPHLQLMCGPLLRYDTIHDSVWRGAVLIVTADAGSVYDPHPLLTYEWDPDIPSFADPRSHPQRSFDLGHHPADPHSTISPISISQSKSEQAIPGPNAKNMVVPAHELWVYAGYTGTFTFWRFLIEIPLCEHEMPIRYSINRGQPLEFFVPGRNQNLRWAAHSCNGFSAGINPDDFRGPGFRSGYDPLWVDLLTKHAERPFHVMVGGGDQIYCDSLMREPEFQDWVSRQKPEEKQAYPLSQEMAEALDRFYFNHYCQHFRSGAFARANSSIPMVNMADDHDLIDGFGSYPDDLQTSPVFSAIGRRGYFFFLLFQCFINVDVDGTDDTPGKHVNRSIIIGNPGPYVKFPSHSFLASLGPQSAIILLDCRAERKKEQVCSPQEYNKVFSRLYNLPASVQHLIVQIGIPIAYPRMVFLETALDSKLNPLVALGKAGNLGLSGFVNKFNAEAELLDDLNDHWTAKSHKAERNWFIGQLQQFAKQRGIRVTFLSGDVHCAAVGILKTLKAKGRQELPPAVDHRYMLNIVTSAIVNTPPPPPVLGLVSSLATKVHKTMHQTETDETMWPLFGQDPDGTQRKQKHIMGRRNWCQVDWDASSGDLIFDIRVEKAKGEGNSVGYPVRAPPPGWQRG
ncbi:hypothetical protein BDN72DRAFT_371720 [Pluteus cervinus]|uniref:Uncharacterized protein n=1 Tax=Pluteus cervinus TaxID=181527 RepID=A0ACD3B299_9AGAR|nr:hypothetical protein BDN72DRAFT_371720 [Pluteus cervinus]